jgi:hypothetical protein
MRRPFSDAGRALMRNREFFYVALWGKSGKCPNTDNHFCGALWQLENLKINRW